LATERACKYEEREVWANTHTGWRTWQWWFPRWKFSNPTFHRHGCSRIVSYWKVLVSTPNCGPDNSASKLESPIMSNELLLPNHSGRRRTLVVLALTQLSIIAVGCATLAGFEDFSSKGSGSGGSSSRGGSSSITSSGGQTTGGFAAATGGQPANCGDAGQHCCASDVSCRDDACCVNGNCVAQGTNCGSTYTCQTGHCTGCGQLNQPCCNGSCEFGFECANSQCRACGASGQSCCDNANFPKCNADSVCVGATGSLGNVCSSKCGAQDLPCCVGTSYTGNGCEVATALSCNIGVCRN